MSNKKDEMRRERRVRGRNKKIAVITVSLIAVAGLAAAAVILLPKLKKPPVETVWDPSAGDEIVASIDGNKITATEFAYYFSNQIARFEQVGGAEIWEMDLSGETPESLAKQKALEDIRLVKECTKRAKDEDMYPDSSDIEESEAMAGYYETTYPEHVVKGLGLNAERIKQIMLDNLYSKLLYESYTDGYVPDSPGYETELAKRTQEETDYWVQNAKDNGQYDTPFTEQELKEIADRVENQYLSSLKSQYFETIVSPWVENLTIEINHEVYDKITVTDLKQQ